MIWGLVEMWIRAFNTWIVSIAGLRQSGLDAHHGQTDRQTSPTWNDSSRGTYPIISEWQGQKMPTLFSPTQWAGVFPFPLGHLEWYQVIHSINTLDPKC